MGVTLRKDAPFVLKNAKDLIALAMTVVNRTIPKLLEQARLLQLVTAETICAAVTGKAWTVLQLKKAEELLSNEVSDRLEMNTRPRRMEKHMRKAIRRVQRGCPEAADLRWPTGKDNLGTGRNAFNLVHITCGWMACDNVLREWRSGPHASASSKVVFLSIDQAYLCKPGTESSWSGPVKGKECTMIWDVISSIRPRKWPIKQDPDPLGLRRPVWWPLGVSRSCSKKPHERTGRDEPYTHRAGKITAYGMTKEAMVTFCPHQLGECRFKQYEFAQIIGQLLAGIYCQDYSRPDYSSLTIAVKSQRPMPCSSRIRIFL